METLKKIRKDEFTINLNLYNESGGGEIWEVEIIRQEDLHGVALTEEEAVGVYGYHLDITFHDEDTARTVFEGILLADYLV